MSDLYSPCAGDVIAVNEALEAGPEMVNDEPYGNGWIIRLQPSNASDIDDLMSATEYDAFVAEQG